MKIQAQPSFELRESLFNPVTVNWLSEAIAKAHPDFCSKTYNKRALAGFKNLGLKERMDWLAQSLKPSLPEALPEALNILLKALPPPLDPKLSDQDFGHFIWGVPAQYAAIYGCEREHLDLSLNFLRECTQRFSAEFALRPFLLNFPKETLKHAKRWSKDKHYHVRRLASEGTRPRLPWAQRVQLPLEKVLPLLDELYHDKTQFVRRSVANHLNDLSKTDPLLVIDKLGHWKKQNKAKEKDFLWLIKHSLRNELKNGNPNALALLDYDQRPQFKLTGVNYSQEIQIGGHFDYQAQLISEKDQHLMITLNIYFLKANQSHIVKSYKVADTFVKKGECLALKKSIAFKPMSTRSLYIGQQYAQLQVNGVKRKKYPLRLNPQTN